MDKGGRAVEPVPTQFDKRLILWCGFRLTGNRAVRNDAPNASH
jgi:hypothetical protein